MSNIDLAKRAAKEDEVTMYPAARMTRLVNLTPHEVIIHHCRQVTAVAPSGVVARVGQQTWAVRTAWDAATKTQCIPLVRSEYGGVVGLPEPVRDTMYIVSSMVRSAVPSRDDVASPTNMVRDAAGNVLGCKALEINAGGVSQ
jgi:hypothetical protein